MIEGRWFEPGDRVQHNGPWGCQWGKGTITIRSTYWVYVSVGVQFDGEDFTRILDVAYLDLITPLPLTAG